jgi:transposase-like protein
MTRYIVGNRMIIKCPYCKSEISILLNPFNKKGVKEKIFKCPVCNKEI